MKSLSPKSWEEVFWRHVGTYFAGKVLLSVISLNRIALILHSWKLRQDPPSKADGFKSRLAQLSVLSDSIINTHISSTRESLSRHQFPFSFSSRNTHRFLPNHGALDLDLGSGTQIHRSTVGLQQSRLWINLRGGAYASSPKPVVWSLKGPYFNSKWKTYLKYQWHYLAFLMVTNHSSWGKI